MRSMGWHEGSGLGRGGGILEPVEAVGNADRRGVGSKGSGFSAARDDLERARKAMRRV